MTVIKIKTYGLTGYHLNTNPEQLTDPISLSFETTTTQMDDFNFVKCAKILDLLIRYNKSCQNWIFDEELRRQSSVQSFNELSTSFVKHLALNLLLLSPDSEQPIDGAQLEEKMSKISFFEKYLNQITPKALREALTWVEEIDQSSLLKAQNVDTVYNNLNLMMAHRKIIAESTVGKRASTPEQPGNAVTASAADHSAKRVKDTEALEVNANTNRRIRAQLINNPGELPLLTPEDLDETLPTPTSHQRPSNPSIITSSLFKENKENPNKEDTPIQKPKSKP